MDLFFIVLLVLTLLLFTKIIDLFFKALEVTIKLVVPAILIILFVYVFWNDRPKQASTKNKVPRQEQVDQYKSNHHQQESSDNTPPKRKASNTSLREKRMNVSPSDFSEAQLDRAVVEEYSNRYVITIYK